MGKVRSGKVTRPGYVFRRSNYEPLDYMATIRCFMENDLKFRQACQKAGIQPTKLAARKFKQKRGLAYRAMTAS